MVLRVPVCEGKVRPLVVAIGGQGGPLVRIRRLTDGTVPHERIVWVGVINYEGSVLDALFVLVNKHKDSRGSKSDNLGEIVPVSQPVMPIKCQPFFTINYRNRQPAIHRVTAESRQLGSFDGRAIRRAAKDANRSRVQSAGYDIALRGVGLGVAEHPGAGRAAQVKRYVQRQPVVVVVGIHGPGESELLEIVQALGTLSARLGSVQSRQQHPRQNRDAGDDDQQFDQGKAPAWLGLLTYDCIHYRSIGVGLANLSEN